MPPSATDEGTIQLCDVYYERLVLSMKILNLAMQTRREDGEAHLLAHQAVVGVEFE